MTDIVERLRMMIEPYDVDNYRGDHIAEAAFLIERYRAQGVEPEDVGELIEAAAAFEGDLSEYCDGENRDRLRAILARVRKTEGETQ